MHAYTHAYVLATHNPIISLVRRNDHNPYCVCYCITVTDARRSGKQVDHFFCLFLRTIQLVTLNDKALAAIVNWGTKEGQDYV
jgi:hypothetical protein